MPFTVGHPAAVIPLARRPLVPSALVMGSMAPDLPYFAPWVGQRWMTHSRLGAYTTDLALAMVMLVVFHFLLKWPLVSLAPEYLRRRLVVPARVFSRRPMSDLGWVIASTLIGTTTHLVWDALTHDDTGGAHHRPDHTIAGHSVYQIAQYGSSALGLAVILWWVLWWSARAPCGADAGPRVRGAARVGVAAAVGVAVPVGAVMGAPWEAPSGGWVHARLGGAAIGAMVAVGVVLIVYAMVWQATAGRTARRIRPE